MKAVGRGFTLSDPLTKYQAHLAAIQTGANNAV